MSGIFRVTAVGAVSLAAVLAGAAAEAQSFRDAGRGGGFRPGGSAQPTRQIRVEGGRRFNPQVGTGPSRVSPGSARISPNVPSRPSFSPQQPTRPVLNASPNVPVQPRFSPQQPSGPTPVSVVQRAAPFAPAGLAVAGLAGAGIVAASGRASAEPARPVRVAETAQPAPALQAIPREPTEATGSLAADPEVEAAAALEAQEAPEQAQTVADAAEASVAEGTPAVDAAAQRPAREGRYVRDDHGRVYFVRDMLHGRYVALVSTSDEVRPYRASFRPAVHAGYGFGYGGGYGRTSYGRGDHCR